MKTALEDEAAAILAESRASNRLRRCRFFSRDRKGARVLKLFPKFRALFLV